MTHITYIYMHMIFRYFHRLSIHTMHTYHTPIASKERMTQEKKGQKSTEWEEEKNTKERKGKQARWTDWLIDWMNGREHNGMRWDEMTHFMTWYERLSEWWQCRFLLKCGVTVGDTTHDGCKTGGCATLWPLSAVLINLPNPSDNSVKSTQSNLRHMNFPMITFSAPTLKDELLKPKETSTQQHN